MIFPLEVFALKPLKLIAFVCTILLGIGFLNLHALPNLVYADGTGGQMTWGSILVIQNYNVVATDHEIEQGHYGYVFNKQPQGDRDIPAADFDKVINGDPTKIVQEIEHGIPGSKVTWVRVSWEKAEYFKVGGGPYGQEKYYYHVAGLTVEAIVENVNGGITGLEIIGIIIAVTFLIAVIVLLAVGGWLVWEIVNAIKNLGPTFGPPVMIIVGLLILVGIGLLVFFIFGGRIGYKGKQRSLEVGRGDIKTSNIFLLDEVT